MRLSAGSRSVGAVLAVAAMVAAVVLGASRLGRSGTAASTRNDLSAAATANLRMPLPVGYDRPSGITADAQGGVWAFAESASSKTLFHWTVGGSASQYNLANPDPDLSAGAETPMTVLPSGVVVIGINQRLVSFDPGSKTWTVSTVPTGPLESTPATSVGNAPPPQAFELISGVAAGPAGSVLVTEDFASAIEQYSPSANTYQRVALPQGTEVLHTGGAMPMTPLSSGKVAVVLWDGSVAHLDQWDGSSWSEQASQGCAPRGLEANGAGLAVDGDDCVATSPSTAGAKPTTPASALPASPLSAYIAPGDIAYSQPGSIAVIADTTGQRIAQVDLGSVAFGLPSGPSAPQSRPTSVPAIPSLIASTGDGNLYYVDQGPPAVHQITFAPS